MSSPGNIIKLLEKILDELKEINIQLKKNGAQAPVKSPAKNVSKQRYNNDSLRK